MNQKAYNILSRFSEPSSWGGILGLLIAFGTPAGQANAVVQIGLAICGAAAIFIPEAGGQAPIQSAPVDSVAKLAQDVAAIKAAVPAAQGGQVDIAKG